LGTARAGGFGLGFEKTHVVGDGADMDGLLDWIERVIMIVGILGKGILGS